MRAHILFFFYPLSHYGLSQDLEYSSLFYTFGTRGLPILNVISLLLPIPDSQSIPLPPHHPLGSATSVLYVYEFVSVLQISSSVPY